MNEEKGYKQVRTPDVSRIADIVLAAKGVERTMAKFAEDTGINASTLSRMANGKIKKPLTMDVIDAIMDKKSPSCEVGKDALIRANGMIDQEIYERRTRNDPFFERRHAQQDRMINMRTTLLNELYVRGVGYKKVSRDEMEEGSVLREFESMQSRLVLNMLESNNERYWGFALNTSKLDPEDMEDVKNGRIRGELRFFLNRILSNYASIFLADAWEPESMEDIKSSFVFCDEFFYNAFRERMEKAKISSNMTTILLNLEEGKVIKEEPIPGCEKHAQDHYFDMSVEDADDTSDPFGDDFMQMRFKFDIFDE